MRSRIRRTLERRQVVGDQHSGQSCAAGFCLQDTGTNAASELFSDRTDGKYFVDLPGYGFAKAPEEIRSQWEGLLAPYLRHREALSGLVLIMDSRHPLTELDLQMLGWFAPTGKPIHVLLSKADKLSRQQQALAYREVQKVLNEIGGNCTLQLFSSLNKSGVMEAEAVLGCWLDLESKDGAHRHRLVWPPRKKARPKKRSAIGWGARNAGKR
jgi:GTP-binding protein